MSTPKFAYLLFGPRWPESCRGSNDSDCVELADEETIVVNVQHGIVFGDDPAIGDSDGDGVKIKELNKANPDE